MRKYRVLLLLCALIGLAGCKFSDWMEKVKPTPPPAPPPVVEPPKPQPVDAIPIEQIRFNGGNPSGYKLTANLKSVSISGGDPGGLTGPIVVASEWDIPKWPPHTKEVIGNYWIIFRDVKGDYQAGVWEMARAKNPWVRVSEAKRGEPPFIQANGPASKWMPFHGEKFWYMVSTPTRGVDAGKGAERSNIIEGVYP